MILLLMNNISILCTVTQVGCAIKWHTWSVLDTNIICCFQLLPAGNVEKHLENGSSVFQQSVPSQSGIQQSPNIFHLAIDHKRYVPGSIMVQIIFFK